MVEAGLSSVVLVGWVSGVCSGVWVCGMRCGLVVQSLWCGRKVVVVVDVMYLFVAVLVCWSARTTSMEVEGFLVAAVNEARKGVGSRRTAVLQ